MNNGSPLDDFMDFARQRGTTSVDTLRVKRLTPDATLPIYGSNGAAGLDLSADLSSHDSQELCTYCAGLYDAPALVIAPGERRVVKTGISIALPRGTYGRVAPRSGLAVKKGIDVMAGVIDEDYRGQVGVVLINMDFDVDDAGEVIRKGKDFVIYHGDRIAQLIVEKYVPCIIVEMDDLDDTSRGSGGFGSTGTQPLLAGESAHG